MGIRDAIVRSKVGVVVQRKFAPMSGIMTASGATGIPNRLLSLSGL